MVDGMDGNLGRQGSCKLWGSGLDLAEWFSSGGSYAVQCDAALIQRSLLWFTTFVVACRPDR